MRKPRESNSQITAESKRKHWGGRRVGNKLFLKVYVSKLNWPIKFSTLDVISGSPIRHITAKFQNSGNKQEIPQVSRREKKKKKKADHSQIIRRKNSFRLETGSNSSKLWWSYFWPRILYLANDPAIVWRWK